MENRTISKKNLLIAVLVAALVIVSAILVSITLNLNLIENLVMSWVLTVLYALFAFYLADISVGIVQLTREKPIIQTIEKPVYIEKPVIREVTKEVQVPIQIPVENKTIEVVQAPGRTVYVETPVVRKVYIEKHRNLNIPKYDFVASTETKTYHKKSCRLGKLIKKKFKLNSNSQSFFKNKHFKACKTCIKRK